MAKKTRRRVPAWQGGRRTGAALRERRPYKSRRTIARGKAEWFLRTDNVFFWSGEWRELSLPGRSILDVLRHLADGDDPYRWIYVSDRDLMHYAGISRPTVIAALCDLQEHGCIEGERGRSQPGQYRLAEKVLRFSHGRCKAARRRAAPLQAKPPAEASAKPPASRPTMPEVAKPRIRRTIEDLSVTIPADLADLIPPVAWQRLKTAHGVDHLGAALIVYKCEAGKGAVKKPRALFNYLLKQDWIGERAEELETERLHQLVAAERAGAEAEQAREEREQREARDLRHARDFTQEEINAYSEITLANLHINDFARKYIKMGDSVWKQEMWRLIEEAEERASQDAPETTQNGNEAYGPDVPAEAAQTI